MTTARPKRNRLNIRIPPDLLTFAKKMAKRRNTTVTQIVLDHLTRLQGVWDEKSGSFNWAAEKTS